MDGDNSPSIDITITVRNIYAASFEDAKIEAMALTEKLRPSHVEFGLYAAREGDGSYTVTLR